MNNSISQQLRGLATPLLITTLSLSLGACAGMSNRERNVAIGAGAGAVGGAILTGGSATGTAVGAVVGGVVANEVNKKKKRSEPQDESAPPPQ